VKFTESGGEVRVAMSRSEDQVRLEIRDTGCGFPTEGQGPPGTSGPARPESGAGLGLPIAREIARAHQGRIWIETSGEEPGTTAVVQLPTP
jgi:signal transduction histidine kinase